VKGTTGVATAWGVQHYLKYWCNADVSWSGDQLNLTHPLPPVDGTVTVNSPHSVLDIAITKMFAHQVIHLCGGIGLGGKEKLTGWH
jgi:hypothetical protein